MRVSDQEIERLVKPQFSNDPLEGEGTVIIRQAPNFTLFDHTGDEVNLKQACAKGPVLLAFYPNDFTAICTTQLCNYRDSIQTFKSYGLELFGISSNTVKRHSEFAKTYDFPFKLLSDYGGQVARTYGCSSMWMLGGLSRAVFILNKQGLILYKYVEPTILTRRTANELITVLGDLRSNNLI